MKVYTRRGDRGETDLFGGERVGKDAVRVEAFGAIDELNASVGCAVALTALDDLAPLLERIQSSLFDLGSVLATPDAKHREKAGLVGPDQADIDELEAAIDACEAELSPLRRFILPGGTPAAAAFHSARTVCRRAERRTVSLQGQDEQQDPLLLGYVNRLSDLLFVLARLENHRAGVADREWTSRGSRTS